MYIMNKNRAPIVAIVGRANVGKSSLFNAVLGRREAIVAREPGTTRDSISAKASLIVNNEERDFWLVDTAGLKDPDDEFEFTIQEQIAQAASSADIILVMIEANTVITEEDRRVARLALRTKKPVLLVVNKIDKLGGKLDIEHSKKLGIKNITPASMTQGTGIGELLEKLAELLPKAVIPVADDRLRIALLGRPNVGKSALFNALAKKQQAIVADRAGTTRDINRLTVRYKKREVELMDTAGIRRSSKIGVGIEHFSVIRSLAAIEQADICMLLMEASELNVQLDQKIAGMVKESGKGLVLVVSKWDAAREKDAYTRDRLAAQIAHTFDFVAWAPLILTSAVTGQNVTKLFDLSLEVAKNRERKIPTSELNRWLRRALGRHPPAGLKNRQPKLNYIVQEKDNPTPAFKVFGTKTKFLHWSYKRYLDRSLRDEYDFSGTPIQFWFFDKKDKI